MSEPAPSLYIRYTPRTCLALCGLPDGGVCVEQKEEEGGEEEGIDGKGKPGKEMMKRKNSLRERRYVKERIIFIKERRLRGSYGGEHRGTPTSMVVKVTMVYSVWWCGDSD